MHEPGSAECRGNRHPRRGAHAARGLRGGGFRVSVRALPRRAEPDRRRVPAHGVRQQVHVHRAALPLVRCWRQFGFCRMLHVLHLPCTTAHMPTSAASPRRHPAGTARAATPRAPSACSATARAARPPGPPTAAACCRAASCEWVGGGGAGAVAGARWQWQGRGLACLRGGDGVLPASADALCACRCRPAGTAWAASAAARWRAWSGTATTRRAASRRRAPAPPLLHRPNNRTHLPHCPCRPPFNPLTLSTPHPPHSSPLHELFRAALLTSTVATMAISA